MDRRAARSPAADSARSRRTHHVWTLIAALEVVAASAAVLLDLLIPTFVLLAMAGASLLVRRDGLASLGLHRTDTSHLALKMLAFAAVWSVFQLAVTMPIANHLSGQEQDLSAFADLRGNMGLLLALLALSWTVAALGEEVAYRGYLQTRMRELFGGGRTALIVAVACSSILFGIAHSEQGVVGVAIVTLDAVAFSVVRYRCRTLWASVLAHGFNNTIGFVAFFLVGPVHGLW
jgi:membrane protease YdiL (CAAX protease family)